MPTDAEIKRKAFLPVVTRCFIERGYRAATTAELAERCGVRENVLYRVWPNKRGIFLDVIEHVHEWTLREWERISRDDRRRGSTRAERLVHFEAADHGQAGHHRIIFAALNEDDPQIRAALRRLYAALHAYLSDAIAEHRATHPERPVPSAEQLAWAVIGVGAVMDIQRELSAARAPARSNLMLSIGSALLGGRASATRIEDGSAGDVPSGQL